MDKEKISYNYIYKYYWRDEIFEGAFALLKHVMIYSNYKHRDHRKQFYI